LDHKKQLVKELNKERSQMSSMRTATLSNLNQRQIAIATPAGEFTTLGAHGPDSGHSPTIPQPSSFLGSLEANIAPKYKHGMQLCVTCLDHLCGRYDKQHAINHSKSMKIGHSITINTQNLQVWCYECDQELTP
jgi:hypothetical protein